MSGFKPAEKSILKLKLAITGPSGSGKTYSALRLATGLGGKIAVIDTENGSASFYADKFTFDVLEISPPYTNEKYLGALNEAVKAGYATVIIDSLTHQWAGEGGLLNKKEQMDARGGNSFANWAKMTPEHEKFKSAILHSEINVIGTMRSKTDYALGERDNGKTGVKKLGLAPIQRDGFEYEFTTVFDVAMNHQAEASKDRTGLFVGKIFQITEETGKQFSVWLNSGSKRAVVNSAPTPINLTPLNTSPVTATQPKPIAHEPSPVDQIGMFTSEEEEMAMAMQMQDEPDFRTQGQIDFPPIAQDTRPKASVTPITGKPVSREQYDRLCMAIKDRWSATEVNIYCFKKYKKLKISELSQEEFSDLYSTVQVCLPADYKLMMRDTSDYDTAVRSSRNA